MMVPKTTTKAALQTEEGSFMAGVALGAVQPPKTHERRYVATALSLDLNRVTMAIKLMEMAAAALAGLSQAGSDLQTMA